MTYNLLVSKGYFSNLPFLCGPHHAELTKSNRIAVVGNTVGIATGYGLDDRGSITVGDWDFPLRHHVQTGSGAHPASYPVDTEGSFPGVKRPGCESDHSPPSGAKAKECVELYLHSPNRSSWRGAI
jgi:hypothetical protein